MSTGTVAVQLPKSKQIPLLEVEIGKFRRQLGEDCSSLDMRVSFFFHTLEYYWTELPSKKRYKIRFKVEQVSAWQLDENPIKDSLQFDLCWPPDKPYNWELKKGGKKESYLQSTADLLGITTAPRHKLLIKNGLFNKIKDQFSQHFRIWSTLSTKVAEVAATSFTEDITTQYLEYLRQCSATDSPINANDIKPCRDAVLQILARYDKDKRIFRVCAFCTKKVFIDEHGKYVFSWNLRLFIFLVFLLRFLVCNL